MDAYQACKDIIEKNLKADKSKKFTLIYDNDTELSKHLAQAYSKALSDCDFTKIEWDEEKSDELKQYLYGLNEGDYVFLVQSTSFRMSSYRIRLDLNNRGIYCIEHARLSFYSEPERYIKALTYDSDRYQKISEKLGELIPNASKIKIISKDGSELNYENGFEEAKFNIGDFSNTMGSFFPIGEVFSEPKSLTSVNGIILIKGIPSMEHRTIIVNPFKVHIEEGKVVGHDGPEDFNKVIELISTENEDGTVWLREMGFGLNKNIHDDAPLEDMTAHERYCGYHISLGLKHNIYRKKVDKKINQRFHIDIYCDLNKILIDDKVVFENGDYLI